MSDIEVEALLGRLRAAIQDGWVEELEQADWDRLSRFVAIPITTDLGNLAHQHAGHTRTYSLAADTDEAVALLQEARQVISSLSYQLHGVTMSYERARRVAFRMLGLPVDADGFDPAVDLHDFVGCQSEDH